MKIAQILESIPKEILISVLDEWIQRCFWVSQHEDAYYIKYAHILFSFMFHNLFIEFFRYIITHYVKEHYR